MNRIYLLAALAVGLLSSVAPAAGLTDSLKKGTPDIKSAGTMAFGPDGVLFLADPAGASIFALDTADTKPSGNGAVKIEGLDGKIGALLGTKADGVRISDVKVNPASGNIYLSVMRGTSPILLKIDRAAKITEFATREIPFSSVKISNASDKRRTESITGISYVNGRVIVAGLSNEEFASNLRMIAYPFEKSDDGISVEIYHAAHGAFETKAPVKSFLAMEIAGKTHVLAAYTCTPLVKFAVDELSPGKKMRGTTVAELGNRNVPLDMIQYKKDGKEYVLIANSARGVMKVSTEGIEKGEGLTQPVKGGGAAGLKYETITGLVNVTQLDKLDDTHAIILTDDKKGAVELKSIDLP